MEISEKKRVRVVEVWNRLVDQEGFAVSILGDTESPTVTKIPWFVRC